MRTALRRWWSLIAILTFVVSLVPLMGLSAWLAWERHRFGPWDPRVLLFVRGSFTEEFGLIEPVRGTLRYEAEGPDGPGVGLLHATYRTRLTGERAVERFLAGCQRLKLVRDRSEPSVKAQHVATCREGDLSISIVVEGDRVLVMQDIL